MDLFGQDKCAEWSGSPPDTPELRLVLVGNIGCGKTLTADTLLSQKSSTGVLMPSRLCEVRRGLSEGRRLTVVETPRWYWSGEHLEAGVHRESERALGLAAPGPHAFLILVPVGQFTEMERYIPAQLERVFGAGALGHTLVLLTCGDYLMGRSEEQYMRHDEPQLKAMVDSCGGHWHVINNRQPHERQQVVSLLEKVERLAQSNGGCYLQSALQREVEARVREKEREFQRRYSLQKEEIEAFGALAKSAQKSRTGTFRSRSREETEEKVTSQKLANGLHTKPPQPSPQETASGPMQRSPSFKLSKEGAILSQMSQVTEVKVNQNNQNFINTIHHRITLSGDSSSTPLSLLSPSSSSSNGHSSSSELRLVLLGQSRSGKSTAGNAILGREEFKVRGNIAGATTQQCVKGTAVITDKQVTVVDTPDWFWSSCSPKEMQTHLESCMALCSPGPHAFLLCVPLTHPGHSILHGLGAVEAVFGPNAVQRNTLVLFTYSDLLGGAAVEKYIAEKRPEILKLVEKCGDHHHVMERRKTGGKERGNVPELLEKVEQLVKESGGSCYSFQQKQRTTPLVTEEEEEEGEDERLDEVDRTISTTLHSLKEEEEVEEEVNNSAKPQESVASSSSSRLGSVLRFVGEKVAVGARRVPKLTAGGALLGGAVGLFFGGPAGGTVGAAAGSVAAEMGRRKYGKSKTD